MDGGSSLGEARSSPATRTSAGIRYTATPPSPLQKIGTAFVAVAAAPPAVRLAPTRAGLVPLSGRGRIHVRFVVRFEKNSSQRRIRHLSCRGFGSVPHRTPGSTEYRPRSSPHVRQSRSQRARWPTLGAASQSAGVAQVAFVVALAGESAVPLSSAAVAMTSSSDV